MTDAGRKDFSQQAKEKITPESQKGLGDKAYESVTNAGDSIAGAVQPSDTKSTTQKAGDHTSNTANKAQQEGKSYLGQAQEAAGNAAQAVQDTLAGNTNTKK